MSSVERRTREIADAFATRMVCTIALAVGGVVGVLTGGSWLYVVIVVGTSLATTLAIFHAECRALARATAKLGTRGGGS